MLMGCEKFASTEGSISHNAIFCNPDTTNIILKKTDFINPHQIMINEAANLNIIYIDVNKSVWVNKETPWLGPFYIYPTKQVYDYLNIREIHLPLYLRLSWWYYYISYSPITQRIISLTKKIRNIFHLKAF